MSGKGESGSGGPGCIWTVIGIFVLWGLIFGVTIDGKHYGASCSCERGVTIDKGTPK